MPSGPIPLVPPPTPSLACQRRPRTAIHIGEDYSVLNTPVPSPLSTRARSEQVLGQAKACLPIIQNNRGVHQLGDRIQTSCGLGVPPSGRYWISTPPSAKKRRWQGRPERSTTRVNQFHAGDRQPASGFTAKPAMMPKNQRLWNIARATLRCQSGLPVCRGFRTKIKKPPFSQNPPKNPLNAQPVAKTAEWNMR